VTIILCNSAARNDSAMMSRDQSTSLRGHLVHSIDAILGLTGEGSHRRSTCGKQSVYIDRQSAVDLKSSVRASSSHVLARDTMTSQCSSRRASSGKPDISSRDGHDADRFKLVLNSHANLYVSCLMSARGSLQ